MTALPTILVDGDGDGTTYQPRDWTTEAYTSIDEGIAAADGALITGSFGVGGFETSFDLGAFPADLDNVDTLTITARCKMTNRVSDTLVLSAKIIDPADGSLLASGTYTGDTQLIAINPGVTLINYGPFAFATVDTAATKAQWDSAILILRHTRIGSADTFPAIQVDTLDIDGTYTATAGLTAVGADQQIVWDLLAAVNADQQAVWDVLASVNADQQTAWDVLAAVGAEDQVVWEIHSTVAATDQVVWDVYTTAGGDQQAVWDLLAAVGAEEQTVWNVQATVAVDQQAVWDVLASVNADQQVVWDVLAALASAGRDMQVVWNLQATVGADQQVAWNTLSLLIVADIGRAHLLEQRWRAEIHTDRWRASLQPSRWAAELTQGPT